VNDQVASRELALQTGHRLQAVPLRSAKSRAIWSTALSDHEHVPEKTPEDPRRAAELPRVHVIAAAAVAVASLTAAVIILVLAPNESGLTAAGAVATAGLALAGRLGGLPH
jgi:hypothetical protein